VGAVALEGLLMSTLVPFLKARPNTSSCSFTTLRQNFWQAQLKPLGRQLPPWAHRIPGGLAITLLEMVQENSDSMATTNDPFYLRY
jgi:hypothetical protein